MKILYRTLFILFLFTTSQSIIAQGVNKLPSIQKKDNYSQLIVNEKPWVMLAGELHNSSSSSLEYMEPIWDKMVDMHLNTVIASISWELLEPKEGVFDFELVNGIINGAREHNLKLVLIWFGTWKNTWSTYAPEWVKTDLKRFPRMQIKKGENTGALSAFGKNTLKADMTAFSALMRHIHEIDNTDQTILMMQVENETGILGNSRDQSALAENQFNKPVPLELINYLKLNAPLQLPKMKAILASTGRIEGTWKEVFGYAADEVFQAWFTASYVDKVTSTGKEAYNIPMYANAWIDPNFSDSLKIDYPSGGPVSKMTDIWRAAAPKIDFLAPDIYLEDFKRVCKLYNQYGNPLFIPESHCDARAAANVYYAMGQHNAICFSPFGIDGVTDFTAIKNTYSSLEGFLPFWVEHQGKDKNIGFLYDGKEQEIFELGGFKIKITYMQTRDIEKNRPEAAGLILNTAPGEYYFAGFGFKAELSPLDNNGWAEYISQEEGSFKEGVWVPKRRMNGDELEIKMPSIPSIRRLKVHVVK